MLEAIPLGFLNWLLYLELHPQLGNIWYRIDVTGNRSLNFDSIFALIKKPFTEIIYWYPQWFDLNFITFTGIFTIYYSLLKNYFSTVSDVN